MIYIWRDTSNWGCLSLSLHNMMMWSMVSGSWSQRKHRSFACNPCHRRRSAVQSCHFRITSHRNNLILNPGVPYLTEFGQWGGRHVQRPVRWSDHESTVGHPLPHQSICVVTEVHVLPSRRWGTPQLPEWRVHRWFGGSSSIGKCLCHCFPFHYLLDWLYWQTKLSR